MELAARLNMPYQCFCNRKKVPANVKSNQNIRTDIPRANCNDFGLQLLKEGIAKPSLDHGISITDGWFW